MSLKNPAYRTRRDIMKYDLKSRPRVSTSNKGLSPWQHSPHVPESVTARQTSGAYRTRQCACVAPAGGSWTTHDVRLSPSMINLPTSSVEFTVSLSPFPPSSILPSIKQLGCRNIRRPIHTQRVSFTLRYSILKLIARSASDRRPSNYSMSVFAMSITLILDLFVVFRYIPRYYIDRMLDLHHGMAETEHSGGRAGRRAGGRGREEERANSCDKACRGSPSSFK